MEPKEEVEKQLAEHSLDVPGKPADPLLFRPIHAKKVPSNRAIKKQVFKRFEERNYSGLEQDWKSYGLDKEDIQNFFRSSEGFSVVYSSIVAVSDEEYLEFIVNKFIKEDLNMEILKNMICKDNYYLLRTFLNGESSLEESGKYNEQLGELQIKIFKLLLTINPEGVKGFMRNDDNKKYVTETINSNFKQAEASLESAPSRP